MDEIEAGVIEVETSTYSPLDWFEDYGRTGKRPSDEALSYLADEGYIFDVERANLTDKGFDKLAELGVPIREINVLTLGADVFVQVPGDKGVTKLRIRAGSECLVVFGHRNKRTGLIDTYEVLAGENLPALSIYPNSKHKFSTHKWPATWPVNAVYSVAP